MQSLRKVAYATSSGGRSLSASASARSPLVELREYKLIPAHAASYIAATQKAAECRHEHVPTRYLSHYPALQTSVIPFG